jgi:hypothetical protein
MKKKSVSSLIAKLRSPPAVHNWVKNVRYRRDDMARALHNFAVNPPRSSLVQVTTICKAIVVDQLSLEDAERCVTRIKDPATQGRALWIVRAFHAECQKHGWKGLAIFEDDIAWFPVSAGVRVPVKPTFIVNDHGTLVPFFVICWTKLDFSDYQLRILSTLITEALLTLEEFQNSDAIIVATPLAPHCKVERQVKWWRVGDYLCLTSEEKQSLFDRYAGALSDAERMIIESLS